MTETPDMSVEIARWARACWMCISRYLREFYDQPKVVLSLKARIVKAEAIEALLYERSTWTLRQEHYAKLRNEHHRLLLRIIGAQRKRPDHRTTSYNRAFEITQCKSIETTLRTIILLWAGALIRMSNERLPKRIVFGKLEGAVMKGQGGKEKEEWTDCVQSDIRAFGVVGSWKATALEAEMWVEAVTQGGRRFMAAWKKERVDAARHLQEKRKATRLGESCYRTWKRKTFKATTIGLVDEPKESCTSAKRTKTCLAPRHVDTSRYYLSIYFPPNEQRGGGGRCQTFSFCYPFPVQQTTSRIGHRVK